MRENPETNLTNVFLTGATGIMGMAGLKKLLEYPEKYNITILARPSKKNHKKLKPFEDKGVRIIWGDLLDAGSIDEGVRDADIVLHVGGMVSPEADKYPEKTWETNVGSSLLIADTIKKYETADPERVIRLVYIGSVSQYGSYLPPHHWGKTGNRLRAAKFDSYALSKTEAERIIADSGLKKWVSLRQTGILHPGLLFKANDPITFHVPLNGVLEWVSLEDSATLLEKVCHSDIDENFWCNFYNVGGGEKYRITNYEFECLLLKALGCPAPEKIFEPNWFATRNFHGLWFSDSDELENYLHFRKGDSIEEYIGKIKETLPWYFRLTPLAPAFIIKKFMKKVAATEPLGPLHWIKSKDDRRINAAWGSLTDYEKIKGWKDFEIIRPEDRKADQPDIRDNGSSFSRVPVTKKCGSGHTYTISEFAEKRGGHSCPECLKQQTMLNFH